MTQEKEPRRDIFENVLRELPDPSYVASVLTENSISLFPDLTTEEIDKTVRKTLVENIKIFGTSQTPDGFEDRGFPSTSSIREQASSVGIAFRLISPPLAPLPDTPGGVLQGVLDADKIISDVYNKADAKMTQDIGMIHDRKEREGLSDNEELDLELNLPLNEEWKEKLKLDERVFKEAGIWIGMGPWFPFIYRRGIRTQGTPSVLTMAPSFLEHPENVQPLLQIAERMYTQRTTELTKHLLSDNQKVGIAALCLSDAKHIMNSSFYDLRNASYNNELASLMQLRYTRLKDLVKTSFNDPKISDPTYITEEEIERIIKQHLNTFGVRFFTPTLDDRPSEDEWEKKIARLDEPGLGDIIRDSYPPILKHAEKVIQFAKTGEPQTGLENMYEEALTQYFNRETRNSSEYEEAYDEIVNDAEREALNPANNPVLQTIYKNGDLLVAITQYLFEHMISDNIKKLKSEQINPHWGSNWQWFEWASDIFDRSFYSAADIVFALQKRIA